MLMRDATQGTLIPVHPWWTALRTGAAILTGSSAFYAFSILPLAEVYAILFAAPLLITVLSIPILGEKVGRHRWFAVVRGLIGVLVVLRPGGGGTGTWPCRRADSRHMRSARIDHCSQDRQR
jgi:drug/metabolite transporter (DMT)-like permease